MFDIAINRTIAGVGERHLPDAPNAEDQDVQQCVFKVSKWVDMAKAVVEAEFPDLVVTAFSVFALADEENAVAELAVNQTHCHMLAKLFSVVQALACQIATHRPTDQAI
ncbi:MAG: hypothetical protein ACKPKO_13435 [Candidatus Fonsibacter sp.]